MGLCIDLGHTVLTGTVTVSGESGTKQTITVTAPTGKKPVSGGLKFVKTTSQPADYQLLNESYPDGDDWVFVVRRGTDAYDVAYYVTCLDVA